MLFFKVVVLASLTSSALATLFITSPVQGTVFTGAKDSTITWNDSPDKPLLAQWGNATVGLFAGNVQEQTQLQAISSSINVSKINTIQFKVDPSIGPNGNVYFIRFDSVQLKDAKNPQYPVQAFSAKFELTGMTGKFSAAVQAQVDNEKANPIGGGGTTPTTPTATSSSSSTPSSSPTKANNAAASSTQSNAASPARTSSVSGFKSWMGILAGMAAGALLL